MKNSSVVTAVGVCVGLGLQAAFVARALDKDEVDPRKIMEVADNPPGWNQSVSQVKMTIRDNGGVRERLMTIRTKRYDEAQKSRIAIEAPADLRDTGFLSIDYRAREQHDEQWLYLPALHKVSRIPDSGQADSFVGSDFSFADMTRQSPDDFELKLLERSTWVGDEECWLIEATPRSKSIQNKLGYTKVQTWVSKAKQVPIQGKMWLVEEGKLKYLKASEFRAVDGAWTPYKLQMRTVKGSAPVSETQVQVLTLNIKSSEITDGDFTRQRLEGGV